LRRDDILKEFLGVRGQKVKGKLEGEILVEWTQRLPVIHRVLYVLGPVAILLGYYAVKYFRGIKLAPIDMIVSFFMFIFGSRLAAASKKYSLTTAGAYQLVGTNWRRLGAWQEFESCRREEHTVILTKRKGYPRAVRLRCTDRHKMLSILALANEQISRHRWK
jgi:hypothetical protein